MGKCEIQVVFLDRSSAKISNLSKIFKATQISWFCHISIFQDQVDQKSAVCAKFSMWLKFLDFAKFMVCKTGVHGQKSQIGAKFLMWLKCLDFAKFYVSQARMVKNLKFESNFQPDSNF